MSTSAFDNLPTPQPPFLPSSTLSYFMPEQETCELQFKWIFENLNFWFSDHSDIGVR